MGVARNRLIPMLGRRNGRGRAWFFSLWTVSVLIFLYLPLFAVVLYSFNASKLNVAWRGFSTEWYAKLFREVADHFADRRRSPMVGALTTSVEIAALTALFSSFLGTLGAWSLHQRRFPARRILETLLFLPVVCPEVIMGIGLLLVFVGAGLELGKSTVVVAHTTFAFPFVLAAVKARLDGLDPAYFEAAQDLGAGPIRAFLRVILPMVWPSVVAGGLMAFTLSFDELIVTWFTRGPGNPTLPVHVYGLAKVGLNPTLNAVSTVLILVTVFAVCLATAVQKRGKESRL